MIVINYCFVNMNYTFPIINMVKPKTWLNLKHGYKEMKTLIGPNHR